MSEMSNRYDQHGSAHVIIIVGLVVALVAALGVVFYQNFIVKQSTTQTNTVSNTTKSDEVKTTVASKEYCATYEQLCFTMPDTWKVVDLGQPTDGRLSGEYKIDRLEIRNETGTKVLGLESGISGIGGVCSDEDKSPLSVMSVYTTKLTGYADEWSDDRAYVVRVVSKGIDGKYHAGMYLTTAKELTNLGETQNCGFGYTPLISGKKLDYGNGAHGQLSFSSVGFGGTSSLPKYDTKTAAFDSLNTSDMNKAYDILRSAHYK